MEDRLTEWLVDPTVGRLVFLAVGLLTIRLLLGGVQRSLARRIDDAGLRYRTRKGATLVAYLAAFLFAAVVFSERLGGFTVAFGVAGAGGGVRAPGSHRQRGRLAGRFLRRFLPSRRSHPARGIRGDVIDIGILGTTLMECGQWVNGDRYNGRIVRIANSFVFKEPVFNYSADFPFVWDEILVPVKYGSDYHEARQLLERVADEVVGEYARGAEAAWRDVVAKFLIEHARVAPTVTLSANENWIELTLRYVVDYKRRRATKDTLFTRILQEIDATDGRVGIAASTLNIEELAPLDVRVADEVRIRGSVP